MALFGKDIILDREAFNKAIKEFGELKDEMNKLEQKLDAMIGELKRGWDTPSGKVFFNLYEKRVRQPIEEQRAVLNHIAETIELSSNQYQQVFTEYEEIQSVINNIGN